MAAAVKCNLLHSLFFLSAPLAKLSHCQRSLKCRGEGAGLTFAKECGEIIMKGAHRGAETLASPN